VSVVANVAINLDATGVSSQLKAIHAASLNAANGITQFADRVKAAKAAAEAAQGGFAKASTVQGVFAAKVKNTEQAITAQIAALKQVQSTVQLGGALYQKAGAQIKQYQAVLDSVNTPTEKTVGLFGRLKQAAGSLVGQLAITASAAGLIQTAFATLANQSKAEGALRTLGVNADVATQQFTQLSKELNGQASVVELTAAAYDVASAGFLKTADQTKILEAATKGAVGGMSDINTVGNAVTSVLNAYGMSADQAGLLVDGFIQTQNDGKIVLGEYAALIGRLAPLGAAAGVGIKELNAAVATITAQGVAPEAAVTGLAQAISSILKPTAEAQKLSKELGIDFTETGLRSKGLGGFLNEVATATGGSASKLTTLFGSLDAVKALLPLLSGDMKKFVENILKQDEAAGIASEAFEDMSNTLGGALKEVDTAFKNLVVAFKPITPAIIAPFKVLAGAVNLVTDTINALGIAAKPIGAAVAHNFEALSKAVNSAIEGIKNLISAAIGPAIEGIKMLIKAAEPITAGIIAPFKEWAENVLSVTNAMKTLIQVAAFIGTFALVVNGVAIATKAWAIATTVLATAKKAAGIAAAFLQGVMNPASLATTALALGAASAAAVTLGVAMNESGLKAEEAKLKQSGVADATAAVKDETAKLTGETNKQAAALDQIPPKQQAQVDAAQKGLVILQEQTAAINAQIASLERGASITSARYDAEKAINDLQGQQLERQYGLAQTAQRRLDIAVQIFNNAVNAAKIEYNQALESIALEQRKIELQVQLAQNKLKEIEAEGQLQKLKVIGHKDEAEKLAEIDAAVKKALGAQKEVVTATEAQAESNRQIGEYQKTAAEAQYDSKVLAAQTAIETKLTSDNIGLSQVNAVKLSEDLKRGAGSSDRLATDTGRVSTNALAAAGNFIHVANNADKAATAIHNAANAQERLNAARSQSGGGGGGGGGTVQVQAAASGAYWQGGFQAFAKGGIVTKPTLGLIGEGNENEFIIPESKAAGFAANYLAGARGPSAIPSGGGGSGGGGSPTISIQTGPVMQMNGQNYVTTQDLSRAVQSGVQQTISMMRNDRGTRRAVGLT
jgi:TP901 family phage tail tape measure protein